MSENQSQAPEPQSREQHAGQTMSAEQWAAAFQQEHHREPTMAEYQEALRLGHVASERRPRDPSIQQMADGARQVAAGARNLYEAKVAPAAQSAAHSAKAAFDEQRQDPKSSLQLWITRVPLILPAAAFLSIISLFLPIASIRRVSVNFFSRQLEQSDGGIILFLMLVVIGSSIATLVMKAKWARITTGASGVAAGLVGMINGFGNMASISSLSGASIGIGLVILALLSVVVAACGVLVLMSLRRAPNTAQNE
ncbi:hypothetical protein [Arthrobacter rhizosphaerae]|uniref:hypothetical protein n=1 Tax=Arthrobacter rhizosphaerae TaxID=2855490 RepID=UPI001FF2C03A|nr:hypothetical protein [Arthrobacter rhizosphaerae]